MGADPRDVARKALVNAAASCGFPPEFGLVLAHELRTENAMRRMTGYLRAARPKSMEEAADEMVAIVEQRDRWIEHKRAEHAQAKVTQFYNRERDEE